MSFVNTFKIPQHALLIRPELLAQILVVDESTGSMIDEGATVWGDFQQPLPALWMDFVVRNNGGDTTDFLVRRQVRESWSGRLEHDPPIEQISLAAGASAYWSHRVTAAGIYVATLDVDFKNEISEFDEVDNSAYFRFVLTQTPG